VVTEQKAFETLVDEAPLASTAPTVSLVGMLARSSEGGKFVLTVQDGRSVTLEVAAVKGYLVLGTSVGQTIVRVDVDAEKVPAEAKATAVPLAFGAQAPASGVAPFVLATPQQLPPALEATLLYSPNPGPSVVGTDIVYSSVAGVLDLGPTFPWLDYHPVGTSPVHDPIGTGRPPYLD
jgi:hypothetical protein